MYQPTLSPEHGSQSPPKTRTDAPDATDQVFERQLRFYKEQTRLRGQKVSDLDLADFELKLQATVVEFLYNLR